MDALKAPSDLPDPRDRRETEAWLDRRSESLSNAIARSLKKVITTAYDRFLATLPETSIISSLTAAGDFHAFDSIVGDWRLIYEKEIAPEIEETYLSGAMSAFTQSPGTASMSDTEVASWARVTNDQAVSYMTSASNRLVGVGDTIWNDVRDRVSSAVASGMSNEELKDQIGKLSNFSEYRADTIARTETIGAYVNGDWQGAQLLGEFGPVEKVWVATGDARGREWHTELMGESLPIDEPFDVDGEPMMYPHDPSGSAFNVVNCRCYVEFLYVGDTRPDGSVITEQEATADEGGQGLEEIDVEDSDTASTVASQYGPGINATETFADSMDFPSASRGRVLERVEALRTVADEIDKIHGLPANSMGKVRVRLTGKAENKGGSFTPRTRAPEPRRIRTESTDVYLEKLREWRQTDFFAEAIITDAPAIGSQMVSLAHELGHRTDWDDVGFRSERIWRSQVVKDLQAKYKAEWLQHLDEVVDQESRAILEMARLARTFESMKAYTRTGGLDYREYFYDIKEIWARAYAQWITEVSGNVDMAADIVKRIAIGNQFSVEEMAMLRPHIESVLRARGLMK
jgi:hypothetical protein